MACMTMKCNIIEIGEFHYVMSHGSEYFGVVIWRVFRGYLQIWC